MGAHSPQSIWTEDAELAKNIRPLNRVSEAVGDVLLTGATGYLGRHVLTELLDRGVRVHCLARSKCDVPARERVLAAQSLRPDLASSVDDRLSVYDADLAAPHFGLSAALYEHLARNVTSVIHCAANVSWSRSYVALREANVLPVAELLRLACTGPQKHFCLLSTMAVGYSRIMHARTDEESDPWTYISDIPLGYAQSKCVAERLVRQAAANGLSASIVRPALLLSSTMGLDVNAEDFVSWMIQGCVRLGYAPDVDWKLDVVPVDYAASAVARYARPVPGLRVLHVAHPEPRDWREVVLLLNLYGYRVRLESFDNWCERLATYDVATLPLKRFIGFFTKRPYDTCGATTSQIYEFQGPPRVCSSRSLRELQQLDLPFPKLDAKYFGQYLSALVDARLLAAPTTPAMHHASFTGIGTSTLRSLTPVPNGSERIDPTLLHRASFQAAHSISTEISSWRWGEPIGLYGLAKQGSHYGDDADLLLKVHPLDTERTDTAIQVAFARSDRLGAQFMRFRDHLEFSRGDVREIGVYTLEDRAIRHHSPKCYGTGRDPDSGRSVLLLERLKDTELLDSVDRPNDWTYRHLKCAIRDLAAVHAAWYGHAEELSGDVWSSPSDNADRAIAMKSVWSALCANAETCFAHFGGTKLMVHVEKLLATLEDWIPRYYQQTATLIHNDCNPRNLAFRRSAGDLTLCLYDWELSALAPPQRDTAELLCFVLSAERLREAWPLVELHRTELSRRTGIAIDASRWREGFALALRDLMLRRLTLYTMLHSFARQTYLPRVLQCWKALDAMASAYTDDMGERTASPLLKGLEARV